MVPVVRVVLPSMIEDMKDMPWKQGIFFRTRIPWQVGRQTNKPSFCLIDVDTHFMMLLLCKYTLLTYLHSCSPSVNYSAACVVYRLIGRVWW